MSENTEKNEKYVDDVDMILSQDSDGVFEHNVIYRVPTFRPQW